MAGSVSLQIPTMDSPAGPSRQQYSPSSSTSRPVSVNVHPSSAGSTPSASRKQRASHTVVTSTSQQQSQHNGSSNSRHDDSTPPYTDVYNHPAAVAYASAHPRRTIPKFGPYLLLQTLGEGEFGKVKLGLHSTWGEEVAVKLIRRGNVDSAVRMSKVEREIEVLRNLKHPNIVRLYDVIETDKYIGIIIEYASGGELFDHILAHRYLRERDAAKLFSQLISGVWYIHQKKIVHRDLKLENLLLDRHRNVIITDFGFANRFEHRADDLMQTSCGSPCYAAPELVISEGLYVGSAVDIWSCGVILYAMLAGYLPFDDDPANPDGDNINLLYKYIVNTPLSFPDYISESARDLLCMMLVPDPSRRASLEHVMQHPWLEAYHSPVTDPNSGQPTAFGRTVEELERSAMDQHHQKRLAYQKQMKAAAAAATQATATERSARSQSYRQDSYANGGVPSGSITSPLTARSQSIEPTALYETPTDHSSVQIISSPVSASAGRGPKSSYGVDVDDPFAAPPGTIVPMSAPVESPTEKKKDRHTVQVEYDGSRASRREKDKEYREEHRERRKYSDRSRSPSHRQQSSPHVQTPPTSASERRRGSQSGSSPAVSASPAPATSSKRGVEQRSPTTSRYKPAPVATVDPPSITLASPLDTPTKFAPHVSEIDGEKDVTDKEATQNGSQSSSGSKHKRGMSSVDRLARIFNGPDASSTEPNSPAPSNTPSNTSGSLLSPSNGSDKDVASANMNAKKSRRNTLTVMVEPFKSTMKNRNKGRMASTPISDVDEKRGRDTTLQPRSAIPVDASGYPTPNTQSQGMQASTNKAVKVMQWFRNKSKARDSVTVGDPTPSTGASSEDEEKLASARALTPTQDKYRNKLVTPSGIASQVNTTPAAATTPRSASRSSNRPTRTTSSDTSTTTPSFVTRFRNSVTVGGGGGASSEKTHAKTPGGHLRTHHGAVDQSTVTTRPPPEVMKHVQAVLVGMGVEVQIESEFKFRCIRMKRRKIPGTPGSNTVGFMGGSGNGLAAFNMVGSAASNGVDKRGLPVPSHQSYSGSTGMLRGLLMRRQSSQVSAGVGSSLEDDTPNSSLVVSESSGQEPLYGDPTEDVGDEVKFSVELTRLSGLNDTYSLDIRRLKGNLRSYKFLYDTIRVRAELS
ncbi:CAMK/CAMKL/Kin4 protein kinase [Lentinula guzmanii]|uniref:non-specific serine/threonine protein kinase n=2 Tax=Lentinula TaxID=5352 RepID=A0AA38JCA7_9AGAR|nr:CAMK/CAMKL/Kin4 protein kinase [Lentinula guzmanii]KAJ3784959.1 CAMK/CAMKL/Kin4 protein kinase [Lentinula aff. detonsa]